MRWRLYVFGCLLVLATGLTLASAEAGTGGAPGVTTEAIKLGGTYPPSDPASVYAPNGAAVAAYFSYVNDHGGVNGRKIDFTYLDDGYNPARTAQLTRQLVEQDQVFAIVGSLGTEPNLAVRPYLNRSGVPQVFVSTGASTWGSDYRLYPWTIGFQPSYIAEAAIYGKLIASKAPQATLAVLFENDAFGKDYVAGLKKGLGPQTDKILDLEGYEPTATDVSSQIEKLQASSANTLFVFATPKFAVQAVVSASKLGWHPQIFMTSGSATNTLMGLATKASNPAATEGMISLAYFKPPDDPAYASDPGITLYRSIMAKYFPSGNVNDARNIYGMAQAATVVDALRQAGRNLTRRALMNAVLHLNITKNPFVPPGAVIRTSPTDHFPLEQAKLARFVGGRFVTFGQLMTYAR